MDMRFEVVVVPVVEVDRAKDLDRIRQAVAAAIGAIGDLDRAARVAPSYSEIRRPRLRGRTGRVRRLPAPLAIRSQSQRAPQARAA